VELEVEEVAVVQHVPQRTEHELAGRVDDEVVLV